MVIEHILVTDKFKHDVKKLRDKAIKERIDLEIKRLEENANLGKSLQYGLKGERTVRIPPYRLVYSIEGTMLVLLRFEHRDKVYDQ